MLTTSHHLYIETELRRINTGWRRIEVRRGRRWAYLKEAGTSRKDKVPVAVLDALLASRRVDRAPQSARPVTRTPRARA
jgi:hypothetical protein